MIYKLYFFIRGLDLEYKRNSTEILVDFRELEFLETLYFMSGWRFLFFKRVMVSKCLASSWLSFEKLSLILGHAAIATW